MIGDDFAGGYTGAQYLHELGHEKILGRLIQSDYTLESAYGGVLGAIDRGVRFSAVFTFNEEAACSMVIRDEQFNNKI